MRFQDPHIYGIITLTNIWVSWILTFTQSHHSHQYIWFQDSHLWHHQSHQYMSFQDHHIYWSHKSLPLVSPKYNVTGSSYLFSQSQPKSACPALPSFAFSTHLIPPHPPVPSLPNPSHPTPTLPSLPLCKSLGSTLPKKKGSHNPKTKRRQRPGESHQVPCDTSSSTAPHSRHGLRLDPLSPDSHNHLRIESMLIWRGGD